MNAAKNDTPKFRTFEVQIASAIVVSDDYGDNYANYDGDEETYRKDFIEEIRRGMATPRHDIGDSWVIAVEEVMP